LKASDGISVSRRAGRKMVIARTEKELMENYDEMADPRTPDLMLQEYIPGDDSSAWMFNGYFDERSECLFGFTGRKIHQNPVYTGITSLGICVRNETIDLLTRRFIKRIGYRGILDIDYQYDARDGRYKVLDVNPRIGATFRLFVDDNDMDVVRAMYLDMTGQPVPSSRPRDGRKWMVEDLELSSGLHYRLNGG
jgi:predicted ATP-grasp superfamily ATP-dependent carboligase